MTFAPNPHKQRYEQIGAQLAKARRSKGFSQHEVCKQVWPDEPLTRTQGRLSAFERGIGRPGQGEIDRIADVLSVPRDRVSLDVTPPTPLPVHTAPPARAATRTITLLVTIAVPEGVDVRVSTNAEEVAS